MTRQEHVRWAKKRALEYLERDDLNGAVASMSSDLSKHPDTEKAQARIAIVGTGLLMVSAGDRKEMIRKWIDGVAE